MGSSVCFHQKAAPAQLTFVWMFVVLLDSDDHCLDHFEKSLKKNLFKKVGGTSLVVQWLGLHASNAGGVGSVPGRRTKIPHATWHSQKFL